MYISRPARRHVAAIANHPGGPLILGAVAKQAAGFSEVIGSLPRYIAEIISRSQRAADFSLHAAVTEGFGADFQIGPIVRRIPDPAEVFHGRPSCPFEAPGQRGGFPPVKNRMPRALRNAARGEHDAMTDRGDGLVGIKKIADESLQLLIFEVLPHAACPMPAR